MDSKASPYQVIARKYRPQTFASVVGQEAVVTTLKNAIRFNRLAHAYLFSGCRGTGKTTLARVFAKALNCSSPGEDFEPCNACSSCLDIIAGRSLDVLEIDGASNRGIDDIRQINETIGYAPNSGKYRIYIIDEVHMLTKEAFNALLKTLEEPPANVKFFFATTEAHKVLPTIISRCQRFDLNRIPLDALRKKLAWIAQDLNVECEDEVISMVANLSEGSLRDAESLLDQIICYAEHPITAAKVSATLGIMPRSSFFSLDEAFNGQNLSFAFDLANELFSSGKDLSWFIDGLIEHYRCLLKLKLGAPLPLPTSRLVEQYNGSASLYSEEQCLYILDFLIHWQQQIGKTPFKRISLEMILLHIIRSKHRLALPTLIRRLHELEQKLPPPSLPVSQAPVSEPLAATPVNDAPRSQVPVPVVLPINSPHQGCVKAPAVGISQEGLVLANTTPSCETSTPGLSRSPGAGNLWEGPPATLPPPAQEEPVAQNTSPSLEETLMKKIRERIESSPFPTQDPTEQDAADDTPAEEPIPKPSPLLLSKAGWEKRASQETPTTTPFKTIEAESSEEDSGVVETASFTFTGKISAEDKAPYAATFDESIAEGAMDEEKGAADGRLAAGRKLSGKVNEAEEPIAPPLPEIPVAKPVVTPAQSAPVHSSRYDTLMRFAAVELEGTIKKEQPNG